MRRSRWMALAAVALSCAGGQHVGVNQRIKLPEAPPEKLDDQGLLIATIAGNHVAVTAFERLGLSMAGVQVGGTYYANAVRENFLVLPLKPGDYKLDSIYAHRNPGDRTETRYPLDFAFHVDEHQATNLGVIVLVAQQGQQKQYWKLLVDDTKDAAAYLRRHYPALAADLQPPTPILASESKHVDAKLLEAARRDLARGAWAIGEDPATAPYVGAEVGTIARLLRDSQGRVAAFDVLDTGTTSAMRSCSGSEQRFVCSSAEPALYFVHGGKVEKRDLPMEANNVWVHTFSPKGVVLVDEKMNLYTSNDDGATWAKQVWYARKDPLNPLASIKFANGKNGYYVYATFTPDPLAPQVLYSDFGRANYRKVEIPKMSDWQRLLETPEGVLVGPHRGDGADASALLYLLPSGKADWQTLSLPGKRCFFLQHEPDGPEALAVLCDSKFYASKDGGHSWTEKAGAQAKN